MTEQTLDIAAIELYIEEIRYNPGDRDEKLDELVELYKTLRLSE